jgi:glycerol uptake facilitator-like aquaporin
VGVGIFVLFVGVVGILNPRRSEVGVFALRFGLTLVGILTVDNGCTFIGGSVNAANCCGAAIFAGRVYYI